MKHFSIFFILVLFFGGCALKKDIEYEKLSFTEANLVEVPWENIKGFDTNDFESSFEVFKLGCTKSARFETLKNVCTLANTSTDPKGFFTSNFTPYKLYSDKGLDSGLMTGYYEPILNGSRTKSEIYKYPIYKVPNDIYVIDLSSVYPELGNYRLRGRIEGNKIVPYYSRSELKNIDESNFDTIVYVDSEIDLFFLHIQGSGKVKLEDGTIINVGYGMQNGHRYYSIGRKLIEIGALQKEDVSLQTISKWLEENPHMTDEILNLNQSYIFFTENTKSATGSLGIELKAQKKIAVDRRYIPLGFPVFINTTNPITKEPIDTLVLAADTGGAIKGEIRGDFFWGNTQEAKEAAGLMKEKVTMYLFVPNDLISK
ncbi:murein transglycosylase A [Arcobacter sp. FWKO B]|uniref:murein transglycosylase A n=1 Tax=Arcobacter sp. FWKO B TaxID=2593672 RepID=UPI0018A4F78D|nr:murein transglycosylase A [Arcobacter sp. FWKO B]QOG12549.1 peptidoglycan N-acetylmuramoylhydrolase [Arcobacter sp. FWKO B]